MQEKAPLDPPVLMNNPDVNHYVPLKSWLSQGVESARVEKETGKKQEGFGAGATVE